MFSIFSLVLSLSAYAFFPSPEILSSPALLVNYSDFSARSENFNRQGTETRAFRDLTEMLYDWDNNRPWGSEYFPEANRRLKEFRTIVCPAVPALGACVRPAVMWNKEDVETVQKSLLDSSSLEILSKRWGLEITPWILPLRENAFSLIIGDSQVSNPIKAAYWNMNASDIAWRFFSHAFLNDKDSYRAGFEGKEFPALFAHAGPSMQVNDWLLRHRAMAFAQEWKHALASNKRWAPANPIVDAPARLFQSLFDDTGKVLESTYAELKAKVTGEHLVRFEKERALGDYPEEVYQHLAYHQLRELLQVQGSYLAAAIDQRKSTSARQKALESLLTIQRYHSAPRFFAIELITLMDPITSHAFALDAASDGTVAQTFVFEQLKALLGSEPYAGKALFPAIGQGLLSAELLRATYLDEFAPDVKDQLAGRDFLTLGSEEQIRILKLYLQPQPGKLRPMALYRMGVLLLSTSSNEDLRKLADVVHEARKGNFK